MKSAVIYIHGKGDNAVENMHPIKWTAPTSILYGNNDNLTPCEMIKTFAENLNAPLNAMQNGEHWIHTKEQMRFPDEWI